jgi:hypothetical protein
MVVAARLWLLLWPKCTVAAPAQMRLGLVSTVVNTIRQQLGQPAPEVLTTSTAI